MKRTIVMGAAVGALSLALAATAAAQSVDENRCWDVTPFNCVTDTFDWVGSDFVSYYTNGCNERVFIRYCNEASGLDHSEGEGCRASGLSPGDTKEWRTVDSDKPTGRYAFAWVGSARVGNDWTRSRKWGLLDWKPGW